MKPTCIYIALSYESYQHDRIVQIAMLQDFSRSQVIAYHSREIENILLLLLYYYHLEYIYLNDNWRPGGMVLWIWTWFGIRARLRYHLFHLCRLRTGRCIGFQAGHRLIILNTYLCMGAGRLIVLLSWVLALSGPTRRVKSNLRINIGAEEVE